MSDALKQRELAKADYSVFEPTVAALAEVPSKVCAALGYTPNAWAHWKTEGKIPKVAAVACEGLRRRNGAQDHMLIIKTSHQSQRDMLRTVAKGLGLDIQEL